MPKVVYFTSQSSEEVQLLTGCTPQGFEVCVHSNKLSDAEKTNLVTDADFLLLFPGRISEPVLRAASCVRLIQLVSAGYEGMDLRLCRSLDMPVANNGGSNAVDVAEHTLALILGFYRRLADLSRRTPSDHWKDHKTGTTTYTINGKTVGIVGFGYIGRQVARILRGFGAYLLYSDLQAASTEFERELRGSRVGMIELLQSSDIVTLHVPLTPVTRGLIGRRELAYLKPSALLVNTCRGPVVDEPVLIDALREGRIIGAALDVLHKEPPDADNPLLSMDNVLLTPHVAGVTRDTWERRGEFIFQNMQRVWNGQQPQGIIQETD